MFQCTVAIPALYLSYLVGYVYIRVLGGEGGGGGGGGGGGELGNHVVQSRYMHVYNQHRT